MIGRPRSVRHPADLVGLPLTRKEAQASGSMFYAPGTACVPKGHVSIRRTNSGLCLACQQSPEHYEANRIRSARHYETKRGCK